MKVLFVHQNFPRQYLHLARHSGTQPGHQPVFITQRKDCGLPELRKIVYKPRRTISPQVHHYLRESEARGGRRNRIGRCDRRLARVNI
jgi:hypothetical protein